MVRAMSLEIQNLKRKSEELDKNEEKREQLEAELTAVRKEKSNYVEKCERQEAELKAVRKEKSDYEKKCERQELEAKEVEKWTLKKFEELEREKKAFVLQEESEDHNDAIKARPSVTSIELDIAFDGQLHCICIYEACMC